MSVYFITCREINRVKIGCANDPWDRFDKIKTASPATLKLEAVFNGSFEKEREYHAAFAAHRIQGEWFEIAPEIEAVIQSASVLARQPKDRAERRAAVRLLKGENARLSEEERIEQLVEESLRVEREMLAEHNRIFAALDAERALDLELPTRKQVAA
jgi:hypothetical protein